MAAELHLHFGICISFLLLSNKLSYVATMLFFFIIISEFCTSKVQVDSTRFSALGLHNAKINLSVGLGSYLEALGKNPLVSSFSWLAESTSLQYF